MRGLAFLLPMMNLSTKPSNRYPLILRQTPPSLSHQAGEILRILIIHLSLRVWTSTTVERSDQSPQHPDIPPFPSSGSDEAKPRVDEAVPIEILQSRLPSRPSTSSGRSNNNSSGPAPAVPVFVSPYNTIVHRSFVLQYKSEVLAQHFAVIDREIFLGIKFDELVSDNSMELSEELNVLDWQQFLRDRRRKAELRGGRISVLAAARARFNLVTNFVVSEIALTNAHDRVILVSKFIRIAWVRQLHCLTSSCILTKLCIFRKPTRRIILRH